MTEGDRLMVEYAGVKLTRKNAAELAVRVDRLIHIAVGAERLRCIDLAQAAWSKIIKPDCHADSTGKHPTSAISVAAPDWRSHCATGEELC